MSSDADAAAATVALFGALYSDSYCVVAASVLFIYDAFVTLDREVACFRTSKRTGAPFLFYMNKWISMTFYVMSLVSFASFPSDERLVCALFQKIIGAIEMMQFIPGAVFSALRAYVLSRNKFIGLLILGLSLAPVGSNLVVYANYQLSGENVPPFGCLQINNTSDEIGLRSGFQCNMMMYLMILTYYKTGYTVTIISRGPLIIADILLIIITWTKLSSRDALRDLGQSKRPSLSHILFRDGTIYFVVLLILNILHLVFSLTGLLLQDGNGDSSVTIFTGPITAILISRFLLDLQEANQAVVRVDLDDSLDTSGNPWDSSTPSVISSLGAFIDPDRPAPQDDDMDWDVGSRLDWEDGCRPSASASESQVPSPSSTTMPELSSP